jgi:hypothetical protein
MTVSRLRDIPGIGVDQVGDAADAAADPSILRLENLDTDLRPPAVALETTHRAVDADAAIRFGPAHPGHLARQRRRRHCQDLAPRPGPHPIAGHALWLMLTGCTILALVHGADRYIRCA